MNCRGELLVVSCCISWKGYQSFSHVSHHFVHGEEAHQPPRSKSRSESDRESPLAQGLIGLLEHEDAGSFQEARVVVFGGIFQPALS